MKRRHGFALLVGLVLTLITLPGCGGEDNTNSTNANAANANLNISNANVTIQTNGNTNAGTTNTSNMNAGNMNGNMNRNANVNATPRATPDVGGTPLSIGEIQERMPLGEIAFNVPPSMELEKARTVVLLLSPKQTAKELEEQLHERGTAAGEIKHYRIKISDKMQAVLSGDGFLITPITSDTLPISSQEPTQWSWDVRPQRAGALNLHVILNAIVDLDDGQGPRPYPIRVFDQPYVVKVPRQEGAMATFFSNALPWLLAAVLVPGVVVAWLWYRGRKRPRAASRRVPSGGEGSRLFLSYRREDSAGHVGRLHDALAGHFGPERVFMDIDSIGYGEDFVEAVEKAVGSCAVAVVVIGRQWLSASDKKGNRRLDDPGDFVHLEVATALRRGVKVIPALVQGAEMPSEDVLPGPLAKLARRNAIEISDSRWAFDVERLIAAVEEALMKEPAQQAEPSALPG
jgi:hypothetical protein